MNEETNSQAAVYYAVNNDPRYLSYVAVSINSLRKYNKKIKIFLFIYGTITSTDIAFFEENQVTVINKAEVKAEYLTSLKWFSLNELQNISEDRLLYVDSDTFFGKDVQMLFNHCRDADFYAREELGTDKTKKRHGVGRVNFDYVIIDKNYSFLVKAYKIKEMPFFNTGVMVFNNNFFKKIPGYLGFFEAVLNNFSEKKIPYPARNPHILEEIVTNIMFGKIENFTHSFLTRYISPFFLELREQIVANPGIVMHIWGYYYPEFMNKVTLKK
jgi:lipopolysaccharide biosynthesis glycosyltransferase